MLVRVWTTVDRLSTVPVPVLFGEGQGCFLAGRSPIGGCLVWSMD